MNATKTFGALTIVSGLFFAGCLGDNQAGPVKAHGMNIIAGGVGQDVPARVYEEYGMDTSCTAYSPDGPDSYPAPCPDDNGYPHIGGVCGTMKWSVQFRNDHPTDNSEQKYGLPYNSTLIYSLQEWRANREELRFYWVRYSDTGCKFTDNEVIYCAELTSLNLLDSLVHGCIRAMHRTFPGLDTSWRQGLDYAGANLTYADGTAGAAS